jgi:hypothetical protein
MEQLAQHELFERACSELLAAVPALATLDASPITCLVFCRSGRHRSVGLAKLLAHCVGSQAAAARAGGVRVSVRHLEVASWRRGFCTTCRDCVAGGGWQAAAAAWQAAVAATAASRA